jgi:hypothetical protein
VTRTRRAVSTVVALTLLLGACTRWQPVTPPRAGAVTQRSDDRLRVTRRDGDRLVLWSARIAGDSVVGVVRHRISRSSPSPDDVQQGYRVEPVGVALANVQSMAIARPAYVRTALTVVGVTFLVVATFAIASLDLDTY